MQANFPTAFFILFVFIVSCKPGKDKELNNRPLLGAGLGIAGATIIVKDLDSTRNYYTKVLGFKMPEKLEKGIYNGTRSAGVNFADMSSIELLSVNDTGKVAPTDSFITALPKHYEGVRLYSLHTSSADTTLKWLNAQGFKIDSPRSGRVTAEKPKSWDWDDGDRNGAI